MAISIPAAALTSSIIPKTPSASDLSALRFSLPRAHRICGFGNPHLRCHPTRRAITLVASKKKTFSSFDELLDNADKPVLVDFYATWCGPCQLMVPILEQVSLKLIEKIQVVKIDTEKYPEIANTYRIEALPTFILFKDGKPVDRFEGALAVEQLIQRIEISLQVMQ